MLLYANYNTKVTLVKGNLRKAHINTCIHELINYKKTLKMVTGITFFLNLFIYNLIIKLKRGWQK